MRLLHITCIAINASVSGYPVWVHRRHGLSLLTEPPYPRTFYSVSALALDVALDCCHLMAHPSVSYGMLMELNKVSVRFFMSESETKEPTAYKDIDSRFIDKRSAGQPPSEPWDHSAAHSKATHRIDRIDGVG